MDWTIGYEMLRTTATNSRNAMETNGNFFSNEGGFGGIYVRVNYWNHPCCFSCHLEDSMRLPSAFCSAWTFLVLIFQNISTVLHFFSPSLKVNLFCVWDCDFRNEKGVLWEKDHRVSVSSKPRMSESAQPFLWGRRRKEIAWRLVRSRGCSSSVISLKKLKPREPHSFSKLKDLKQFVQDQTLSKWTD